MYWRHEVSRVNEDVTSLSWRGQIAFITQCGAEWLRLGNRNRRHWSRYQNMTSDPEFSLERLNRVAILHLLCLHCEPSLMLFEGSVESSGRSSCVSFIFIEMSLCTVFNIVWVSAPRLTRISGACGKGIHRQLWDLPLECWGQRALFSHRNRVRKRISPSGRSLVVKSIRIVTHFLRASKRVSSIAAWLLMRPAILLIPLLLDHVALVVRLKQASVFLNNPSLNILVEFNQLAHCVFCEFGRVQAKFIDLTGTASWLMVSLTSQHGCDGCVDGLLAFSLNFLQSFEREWDLEWL